MRRNAHYTREELAALLGLKVQTLAAWACRDRGPVFIKRGRRVRYRALDVAAWLDDPEGYRASRSSSEKICARRGVHAEGESLE